MTDKYGACWTELMENESKESLADLYVGQLVRIAHLEADNATLKTENQRLSAPVSKQEAGLSGRANRTVRATDSIIRSRLAQAPRT